MVDKANKPVAVFDIDGTIFRSSLVIELIEEMLRSRALPQHIKDEYLDSHQQWLNREGSYENYIGDVVKAFDKYTVGIEQQAVIDTAREVIARMSKQTYRYSRKLIHKFQESHFLLAISGSPIEIVDEFAKHYGFDAAHGKISETRDGKYTGNYFRGDGDKAETLESYVREHNLTLNGSVGVGDTETDAAFLQTVDNPIAFNPNSALLKTAKEHGWQVVVERKDVVYELAMENGRYVLRLAEEE